MQYRQRRRLPLRPQPALHVRAALPGRYGPREEKLRKAASRRFFFLKEIARHEDRQSRLQGRKQRPLLGRRHQPRHALRLGGSCRLIPTHAKSARATSATMPDRRLPTSTACFRPRAAAATTSSPVTSTRPEVKYWGPINEIYAEFFGDHRPARVVSTSNLHFGLPRGNRGRRRSPRLQGVVHMQYICTSCGKKVDAETRSACCECGGLFELDYEAPDWDPALIDRSCWSIFRYRKFMAVDGEAWRGRHHGRRHDPDHRVRTGRALQDGLLHAHALLQGPRCGHARLAHGRHRRQELRAGLKRQRRQCGCSLLRPRRDCLRHLRSRRHESQEDHDDRSARRQGARH